ncbi:peptidoglycan editing factor PgeF [Aureimonas mangrovi]|uniref:peptidoglycan editing factor PgeF n=1 Tax=Aureimonas mangrovi TaxID=2758041 RepID=UPI00163DC73D|nr:peptidoglycan editing factor PgeF [Aureimonas mangrovi]
MFDKRLESASHLTLQDVVRSDRLPAEGGIAHAFFTRSGGVSSGIYRGLNVGSGSHDEPEAVRENRSRAAHFLGLTAPDLATPWQIHSPDVAVIDRPFGAERPKVDAVVTATPGFAVAVVTADCGPVLFADEEARIVGAAHAGWRGTVSGVLEATIEAMEGLGATRERIVAVLGPTIMQANYEVSAEMADGIVGDDCEAERFFAQGAAGDKRQFDLPGLIVSRLSRAGVHASFVGRCTYGEEERFFSFRRTTHRGETDYGRQLSAIAITH